MIRRRATLVFPVRQRAQPVGDVDFADRRVDGRRESDLREDFAGQYGAVGRCRRLGHCWSPAVVIACPVVGAVGVGSHAGRSRVGSDL